MNVGVECGILILTVLYITYKVKSRRELYLRYTVETIIFKRASEIGKRSFHISELRRKQKHLFRQARGKMEKCFNFFIFSERSRNKGFNTLAELCSAVNTLYEKENKCPRRR